MMDLADLQSRIERYFREHGAEYGLAAEQVRAEFVLNWGGIGNQSFTVTDGERALHLKISDDPENKVAMQKWFGLHGHLEQHYHAPRVLDWIAVPDTDFAGLLFDHVKGTMPEALSPELAKSILPVIQRLHGDTELAQRLNPPYPPISCRQTYRDTYHDRLTEELVQIAEFRPPFVSKSTLEWMIAEVATLGHLVNATPAFEQPATSPIHGDLWVNNLLVRTVEDWTILDWDNLEIGDPALDLAMLFGPSTARLRPVTWWQNADLPAAVQERIPLYARASLLDWIIDSLADYIEADALPDHAAEVRMEKERLHREALVLYQEIYPR